MPNYFAPQTVDLGELPLMGRAAAEFTRILPGPAVSHVNASCGCTRPEWTNDVVQAVYTADKSLPEWHLQSGLHAFRDEKFVTIYYTDGTWENLRFVVTVTDKSLVPA